MFVLMFTKSTQLNFRFTNNLLFSPMFLIIFFFQIQDTYITTQQDVYWLHQHEIKKKIDTMFLSMICISAHPLSPWRTYLTQGIASEKSYLGRSFEGPICTVSWAGRGWASQHYRHSACHTTEQKKNNYHCLETHTCLISSNTYTE